MKKQWTKTDIGNMCILNLLKIVHKLEFKEVEKNVKKTGGDLNEYSPDAKYGRYHLSFHW